MLHQSPFIVIATIKEVHMTIKVGDRLPPATLREMTDDGIKTRSVDDLVRGRRVVIFGLPGAFTPTCSTRHLPSYIERQSDLRASSVDDIFCVSVNDAYVMHAWSKNLGGVGRIRMIADGNAEFTKAAGLDSDRSDVGMGTRSRRYSMYVEDGIVKLLNLEGPGQYEVSDAGTLLAQLKRLRSPS
jgi:peroxiredoxin